MKLWTGWIAGWLLVASVAGAQDYSEKPPAGLAWGWQGGILFDFDQAKIRADQRDELARLAGILELSPHVHVLLSGRADTTGKTAHNHQLSARRVAAVADFLTHRGIEAERVHRKVYGEDRPVADNAQRADRKRNRRVDIAFFPRGHTPPDPATAPETLQNPPTPTPSPAPLPPTTGPSIRL